MAKTPSHNPDDRFYNPDKLIKAFAILSVLMMIVTVWMVFDDFGRSWKGYQREFLELKEKRYTKLLQEAKDEVDEDELKTLQDSLAEAEQTVASREGQLTTLREELVDLTTQSKIATNTYQARKGEWDVKRYHYESEFGELEAHAFSEASHEAPKRETDADEEEDGETVEEGELKASESDEVAEEIQAAELESPEGNSVADAEEVSTGSSEAVEEAEAEVPDGAHVEVKGDVKNPHGGLHQDDHGVSPEFLERKQKAYDALMADWAEVNQLENRASEALVAINKKKAEINEVLAVRDEAERALGKFRAQIDTLAGAKTSSEFTLQKLVQSSPVIDLASPVFKIQQIVLPEIRDDLFFSQVQKVDRCTTCHQGIDTPGFEDAPQPFTTHPRLDLILGSRSPHPINSIGCTICHDGRGQSTHFTRSAHTPQNEEQQKEWEKKYDWHSMHHVIEKMVPLQYTEGKCRVCHRETEYVPRAEKLNKSVQLVKAAGCYGCHRIEGWDHIRKPAPSLEKVKGKLTREWVMKWVKEPRSFNEMARMPASFFQSHMEGRPEYLKHQAAELNGVVDYVMANSESYQPDLKMSRSGDVERGKELFGQVGCLGCHQIDDFGRERGRFGMAPDLSTVGSKVSQDWLYQWLKNPSHYWEETTMPSFRLTDSEAADITSYLLSKKNEEFEQAEVVTTTLEDQKAVLRLYLKRDPRMAPATESKIDDYLSKLESHKISEELGKRAIGRYGCFGCHSIKGFEGVQGIGVELTEEGSKPIGKFDFGLLHHLPHTKVAWFNQKLTDTRSFDKGRVLEYLDMLRMPQYGFSQEERDQYILFLLGMTSEKPGAAKVLTAREKQVEQGKQVIHKYNCQGCHIVEGMYQPLPDDHPKFDEHEARQYDLEGRVLIHYEDDITLGPPVLYTEGKRVHTDWVSEFLKDPSNRLRKALKIRMPTFNYSQEEMNTLVSHWAAEGEVPFPFAGEKKPLSSREKLAAGKQLFEKLNCLLCHNLGEQLSQKELQEGSRGLAPNLRLSKERLRRDWIIALLKNPNKMIPGTRMPGFWPDGNTPAPEILGGDSEAQIEALADYVISLGMGQRAE